MGARVLVVLALVAACEKRSEKYCELHPTDLAFCPRSDGAIDAPTMCTSNLECAVADPFCEPTSHICVECLTSADCASHPGEQNCDPLTFDCRGCLAHADCPSAACLPDGTCGDDSSVIYVSSTGRDTATCTATDPCATIARALTLLTTARSYIKLSGPLFENVTITGKRATILADPMTTLTGSADPTLKLQMSEIRIFDLAIRGSMGGIKSEMASTTTLTRVDVRNCSKVGVEAKGGYLRVTRSTLADNAGGGIVLDAAAGFAITNSFIQGNGAKGGIEIGALTSGANQLEFNTIVGNTKSSGAAGVSCPISNGLPANNNLIVANVPDNVSGCDFAGSRIDMNLAPYAFASTTDFHIGATSAARDMATAPSTISEDFDGQYRPLGPADDFGADEYKP